MDARRLSNALSAVSGDIGMVANYQAKQQSDADAEAMAARRDAANKAFTLALTKAQMAQQQSQFDTREANDKTYQEGQLAVRNKEVEANSNFRTQELEENSKYHQSQLGLEAQRVGLEGERVKASKQFSQDNRTTSVLGQQLNAIGKRVAYYQKEKEAAINKLSGDFSHTDEEKAAIRQQISAKYDRIIQSQQDEYDKKNAKFSELTGVDFTSTETPDSTDSGSTQPLSNDVLYGNGEPGSAGDNPMGADPASAGTAGQSYPQPNVQAIQKLKSENTPQMRNYFDQIYGPGSSARALGGG